MNNPFENFDDAFTPMYTECITIVKKRRNNIQEQVSVVVSMFQDQNTEPLSESNIETDTEVFQFVVRERDWILMKGVQRGDVVKRRCGESFSIMSVDKDSTMGIIVKARQQK